MADFPFDLTLRYRVVAVIPEGEFTPKREALINAYATESEAREAAGKYNSADRRRFKVRHVGIAEVRDMGDQ